MDVSVLEIDPGKNSCSVVGLDATGRVVVRRRMRREAVITYAATLREMSACRHRGGCAENATRGPGADN